MATLTNPALDAPAAQAAPSGARWSDRRVWWVSFALLTALGALWAISAPMLTGPDEAAHAGKAASVAQGHLTWVGLDRIKGTGLNDPTRVETWIEMPTAYAELDYACIAIPPPQPASCLTAVPRKTEETVAINTAGTYPPAFYALVGWPSRVLAPSKALYGMRAVHALLCAAFLASALVAARRADVSGTMIVGVAAALTPMVFFLAAVINPSGLEIATALCVWCAALALTSDDARPSSRAVARLFVAASLLVLVRPLSAVMLAAAVGVVAITALRRSRLRQLLTDRRVWWGLGALLVAGGFAAFWLVYAQPQNAFWGAPRPELTLGEALRHSFGLFPDRVSQMVGVFGWIDSPAALPGWAVGAWLAVVGVLTAGALVVGTARQRLGVVITLAVTVGLSVSEVTRAKELGFIWQGRYTLPVAVGLPIVAAWVVGRSGRVPAPTRRTLTVVALLVMAVVQVVAHMTLMRRYVVGTPSPIIDYLTEGTWSPRLPTALLLGLTIAVVGAQAWWYAWLARGDAADQDDVVVSPASNSESATV